jgi:hypothetical protein
MQAHPFTEKVFVGVTADCAADPSYAGVRTLPYESYALNTSVTIPTSTSYADMSMSDTLVPGLFFDSGEAIQDQSTQARRCIWWITNG